MKSLTLCAGLAAGLFATAALAHDGMAVREAYALVASPNAQSGAIFMVIENHRAFDDRLIGAETDAAQRVDLHTHAEDAAGVMRMIELEDGILIPTDDEHALARGGDHIMLLGLTRPLNEGDTIGLTLRFELSGELEVEVPVGAPAEGHGHEHGHGHGHSHGN